LARAGSKERKRNCLFCRRSTLTLYSRLGGVVGLGVATTLFLYVFINVAMVMGLMPVVGVPLPFISFGGTAMLTLQVGLGVALAGAIDLKNPLQNMR